MSGVGKNMRVVLESVSASPGSTLVGLRRRLRHMTDISIYTAVKRAKAQGLLSVDERKRLTVTCGRLS